MATFEVLGKLSGSTLGRGSDNSGAPADLWRTSLAVDATVGRTRVRLPGRHAARPGSPVRTGPSAVSALLGRHLVLLADGQPHLADGQSGVDRLDRVAAAQRSEDVVAGHAVGAHRPELTVEAGPELLQAHTPTLTRERALAPQRSYARTMIPGTGSAGLDVVLQIAIAVALLVSVVLLIRNYRGR